MHSCILAGGRPSCEAPARCTWKVPRASCILAGGKPSCGGPARCTWKVPRASCIIAFLRGGGIRKKPPLFVKLTFNTAENAKCEQTAAATTCICSYELVRVVRVSRFYLFLQCKNSYEWRCESGRWAAGGTSFSRRTGWKEDRRDGGLTGPVRVGTNGTSFPFLLVFAM